MLSFQTMCLLRRVAFSKPPSSLQGTGQDKQQELKGCVLLAGLCLRQTAKCCDFVGKSLQSTVGVIDVCVKGSLRCFLFLGPFRKIGKLLRGDFPIS